MAAVTLDLFGTLVDFSIWRDEPPLVEGLLAELGADLPAGDVLGVWVSESLEERARRPFRTVRASLEAGAAAAATRFELDLDPAHWTDRLEALWIHRPLRPEAPSALERLEAAGLRRGIVTNLDRRVLDQVLERTGLTKEVAVAVCSEDVAAYKPDPAPFHEVLGRLGVAPDHTVHVGDSVREDRPGARAAGMRACLVLEEEGGLALAVEAAVALLVD